MSIKGGGFQKNSKASQEVPTSSLADIAFLLLIFFMVPTIFQSDRDRPIDIGVGFIVVRFLACFGVFVLG